MWNEEKLRKICSKKISRLLAILIVLLAVFWFAGHENAYVDNICWILAIIVFVLQVACCIVRHVLNSEDNKEGG